MQYEMVSRRNKPSPGPEDDYRPTRRSQLGPEAFTVLTSFNPAPPSPPSAPESYRVAAKQVALAKRQRKASFVILAERTLGPSRDPSPSGRVSPFRGRGFVPPSRDASPSRGEPGDKPPLVPSSRNTSPSHGPRKTSTTSKIPRRTSPSPVRQKQTAPYNQIIKANTNKRAAQRDGSETKSPTHQNVLRGTNNSLRHSKQPKISTVSVGSVKNDTNVNRPVNVSRKPSIKRPPVNNNNNSKNNNTQKDNTKSKDVILSPSRIPRSRAPMASNMVTQTHNKGGRSPAVSRGQSPTHQKLGRGMSPSKVPQGSTKGTVNPAKQNSQSSALGKPPIPPKATEEKTQPVNIRNTDDKESGKLSEDGEDNKKEPTTMPNFHQPDSCVYVTPTMASAPSATLTATTSKPSHLAATATSTASSMSSMTTSSSPPAVTYVTVTSTTAESTAASNLTSTAMSSTPVMFSMPAVSMVEGGLLDASSTLVTTTTAPSLELAKPNLTTIEPAQLAKFSEPEELVKSSNTTQLKKSFEPVQLEKSSDGNSKESKEPNGSKVETVKTPDANVEVKTVTGGKVEDKTKTNTVKSSTPKEDRVTTAGQIKPTAIKTPQKPRKNDPEEGKSDVESQQPVTTSVRSTGTREAAVETLVKEDPELESLSANNINRMKDGVGVQGEEKATSGHRTLDRARDCLSSIGCCCCPHKMSCCSKLNNNRPCTCCEKLRRSDTAAPTCCERLSCKGDKGGVSRQDKPGCCKSLSFWSSSNCCKATGSFLKLPSCFKLSRGGGTRCCKTPGAMCKDRCSCCEGLKRGCRALMCLNLACCICGGGSSASSSSCRRRCCACCGRKDSAARELDRRRSQATLSKKQSQASSQVPQEIAPKLDPSLVEHVSLIRGAIPVLPIPLAWICLFFNIFVPGLGTLSSGLLCLCFGKPRFSVRDDPQARVGACCLDMIVAIGQMFTILFCLVGWGWSIWWGVIMVKLARKQKKIKLAAEQQERAAAPVLGVNHDAERA